MSPRLLLLAPALAMAFPSPAVPAHRRWCGTRPPPADPVRGKDPCTLACHAAPCERKRQTGDGH